MRVTVFTTSDPCGVGGGSQRVRSIVMALRALADVRVVFLDRRGLDEHPEIECNCDYVVRIGLKLGFWGIIQSLLSLVLGLRPEGRDFIRSRHAAIAIGRSFPVNGDSGVLFCLDDFAYLCLPRPLRRQHRRIVVDFNDYVPARFVDDCRGWSFRRAVCVFRRNRNRSAYRRIYRSIIRKATSTTISSEIDRDHLKNDSVFVLPNAYPVPANSIDSSIDIKYQMRNGGKRQFLFVGSMNYLPNRQAAEWLIEEIWPALRAELPDATLAIVGKSASYLCSKDSSIQVHSDVPDVTEFYKRGTIVLVPILTGSGTRIKILEAWAMGCPVISTQVGVEGLQAMTGAEFLEANSVNEFVEASLRLVVDDNLSEKIAHGGLTCLEEKYSHLTLVAILARLIDSSIEESGN